MERFTFTNKYGSSISIGYNNADSTLLEYDGLTTAEVLPITYKGYRQNGNTVSHIGMGVRIIEIKFLDAAADMETIYSRRRNLAKVFNPTMLGTLKYENDYITVVLEDVEVTTQPSPTNRYGTVQEYEVELTAHNPFFRDENMTVITANNFDFTYTGDIPAPWIFEWEFSTNDYDPGNIYFYNWGGSGSSAMIFPDFQHIDLPSGASSAYYGVCSAYNKKGTCLQNTSRGALTFNSDWVAARIRTDSRFCDLYPGRVNGYAGSSGQTVKLKYYNWYSGV